MVTVIYGIIKKIGDNLVNGLLFILNFLVLYNCRKFGFWDKLEMDNVKKVIVERFG